jgi:DNA-binding winged helix-turn-helix (wHTH) protein
MPTDAFEGERAIRNLVRLQSFFANEPEALFASGRLLNRIDWHSTQCRLLARWLGMLTFHTNLHSAPLNWLRDALYRHNRFTAEAATALSHAPHHCRSLDIDTISNRIRDLHKETEEYDRLHHYYQYRELPWNSLELHEHPVCDRLIDEYTNTFEYDIPKDSLTLIVCGQAFEDGVCPSFCISHKYESPRTAARLAIQQTLPNVGYYKKCHIIPDYLPCELMPRKDWITDLVDLVRGPLTPHRNADRLISRIQKQIGVLAIPKPSLWILVAQLLAVIDKALKEWEPTTKRTIARKKRRQAGSTSKSVSSSKNDWDNEEGWNNVSTDSGDTIHYRGSDGKLVYRGRHTSVAPYQAMKVFAILLEHLRKNVCATKDDLREAWENDEDELVGDNAVEQQITTIRGCFTKDKVQLVVKCHSKLGYKLVDAEEEQASQPRTSKAKHKNPVRLGRKRRGKGENESSLRPSDKGSDDPGHDAT